MRPQALAALLLVACGDTSSTTPRQATPQPVATNSGAFAVVAVGGQLKAYVPGGLGPGGHYFVWVVDAALGRNGASGNLGAIDLGVDGDAASLAATDDLVVAISAYTPYLWFIDPTRDVVLEQLKLPDGYGAWDVSDQNAFMMGVVIDPVRRRAYVSVWSGFLVVDLDAHQFVDEIIVAPSENFAFDPEMNRIVAPFYLCPGPGTGTGTPPPCDSYRSPDGTPITHGLNLVDLDTHAVFTYVDATAPDQSAPIGTFPDAAAMDPAGQQLLVAAEDSSAIEVLDLGTAIFDQATGTFTANKVELATALAFIDLATATADGVAASATMPDLPWGAGQWPGHGDPHGVRGGLVDGKPVAWILSRHQTWVARVDLEYLKQHQPVGTPLFDPSVLPQAVTY
jgi:hypothetical protein